ncbi:MAG: hypothetical protein JW881_10920 [Spirochaetales bacterium]|nr:hypothetical protein [Spirochaetales bacterium]
MKRKKVLLTIFLLVFVIIVSTILLVLIIVYKEKRTQNGDRKESGPRIHSTSHYTAVPQRERDILPLQSSNAPHTAATDSPPTPEAPPVIVPPAAKKPPEPDCIYLGQSDASWHCYRNRRRLIRFHDWQCSNKRVTRIEIIKETGRTCYDKSGTDMFELVDEQQIPPRP